MSAHLFSKGTLFFCVYLTQHLPYSILKSLMDCRSDMIIETTLGIRGTISGPRPLFLLGHHGLTSDRKQLALPVTHKKPGKCRMRVDTPQRAKALLTTQGQRKVSPASGPNRAPSNWVPQGQRPNTCKSKGEERHAGSMCQRCGSSRGRAPAKETLWGVHWSRSD